MNVIKWFRVSTKHFYEIFHVFFLYKNHTAKLKNDVNSKNNNRNLCSLDFPLSNNLTKLRIYRKK